MKNSKNALGSLYSRILAVALIIMLIITQTACSANEKTEVNNGVSKTGFYLDTLCTITIFAVEDSDEKLATLTEEEVEKELLTLITDALKLCDKYEKLLSKTIEDSDISKINRAGGKAVEVSDETIEVLEKSIYYGAKSGGAFDITIGKATDLWGFREAEAGETTESGMTGKVPDADKLAETMEHVDYKKIEIEGNSVRLQDPEMEIDLGGIAKGYIADKVTTYLEEKGVTSAIVDLGGNIVAIGGKADSMLNGPEEGSKQQEQTDFKVGIKDPMSETGDIIGIVAVSDKTIVTSGTYERYFVEGGKKYHHILNSVTGYPTDTDVLSVTIVAEKGSSADCDALSTSCLALGIEKGKKLIAETEGAEAVFIDLKGEIHTTSDDLGFTAN